MKWDRVTIAVAIPVAAVAVIAGIVSYGHIEALALSVHQPIAQARLYPFSVDFLIIAGSVIVLAGYWLGWLAVACGVAGTLYANVMSGLPYGPVSATIAAWPAIAFTVASFVLERWIKRQVSRGGSGGSGWLAEATKSRGFLSLAEGELATPEPVVSHPAGVAHQVASEVDISQDSEAVRSDVVTTVEPPRDHPEPEVVTCGHTVAGTPEQNVVQAFLHERDCLGQEPSQRRLAAIHNVSRPKVRQLVGSLNGHGGHGED